MHGCWGEKVSEDVKYGLVLSDGDMVYLGEALRRK